MPIETIFNTAEAVLWFALALVVAIGARRRPPAFRRNAFIAATVLVVFGVSDLIEVRTGAWWRPWWLFAVKAGCVISLVFLFLKYRLLTRLDAHSLQESNHENH